MSEQKELENGTNGAFAIAAGLGFISLAAAVSAVFLVAKDVAESATDMPVYLGAWAEGVMAIIGGMGAYHYGRLGFRALARQTEEPAAQMPKGPQLGM